MNEDPEAALEALRHAIARAARSLDEAGQDEAVAFRCVVALDETLPQLGELLQLVPGVVDLASPGRTVSQRIARYQDELGKQRAELTSLRATLDGMRDLEKGLLEGEAERDGLRARISELERAGQLAHEIPSLRARVDELESVTERAAAADAADITTRLTAAAGHLRSLTQEQRGLLGERTSQSIADAEAAGQALAAEHERAEQADAYLTSRTEELDQLQAERRRGVQVIKAWRQADADLAEGLSAAGVPPGGSALERVRTALAAIEQRISDIDEQLRPLLLEHSRMHEETRRIRNLSAG